MVSSSIVLAFLATCVVLSSAASVNAPKQAEARADTDAAASAVDTVSTGDASQAAASEYGSYGSESSYGGGGGGSYGGGYEQPNYGYNKQSYGNEKGPGYYGPESYGGYDFQCAGKKPAFYGDAQQDCKVFYICQSDGRTDTFRCPKWTRFNNYLGICDWHFKVDNGCNPLDTYEGGYGKSNYGGSSYGGDSYSGGGGSSYGGGKSY